MKVYLVFLLMFCCADQSRAVMHPQSARSVGSLVFYCNGQIYTADSTHARGYAVKQTSIAHINGANRNNMVIGIEWKGLKGPGVFFANSKEGKAEFTINHKTYSLKQPGNFLKIVVSGVKQQGPFLLLNGTFEGELEDRNGNKIKITEGSFLTKSL